MKSRTKIRSIALQVLYEVDITGHPTLLVLQQRIDEEPIDQSQEQFLREIVEGVFPIIQQLDDYIAQHAPEWPLDQVAIIDRNIIRVALWEFAISGSTPVKVAINEAIELAKMFGSESTPRFVNGVLGSLANRQNEIQQAVKKIK
jgi:N utilization substance protein B